MAYLGREEGDRTLTYLDCGGGWRPVSICQNPQTSTVKKKKKKVNFIISVLQLNKRIKRSPSDFNKVTSTLFRLVLV